jgi:hypothetical protein
MNKSLIGWIFAVVVLLACFAVIAVAGIAGFSLNNSLTKANQDLAAANSSLTSIKGKLQTAEDQVATLTSSLDSYKSLLCSGDSWSRITSGTKLGNGTGSGTFAGQNFDVYGLDNDVWVVTKNIAMNLNRSCVLLNPSWKSF